MRTLPFIDGYLDGVSANTPFHVTNTGDAYRAQCNDSAGRPVADSSLLIAIKNNSWLVPINGTYDGGPSYHATAKDYFPTGLRSGGLIGHASLPTMPSASSSMTSLLARTNPSRPDYVPLTLLQDLVDIPKQLKDVGRLIRTPKHKLNGAEEVAKQYLGWQFGWAPLFQDVRDLLDLQMHIHKRTGELQRLYDSRGLKRRIQLGRWANIAESNNTVESNPTLFVNVHTAWHTSARRWGSVRWLPTSIPAHRPNDAEIIRKAQQVALGLSIESTLKGAWDLIPWTWVVNWFGNFGEYALQYSNTVPARPSSACIMTETYTKCTYSVNSITQGYAGGGGFANYTTKERYVGSSSLDVHLPLLNGDRLAILQALFIQRFKKLGHHL